MNGLRSFGSLETKIEETKVNMTLLLWNCSNL